ncbi:SDR family NAD(P)-dependent oxidoreductase [Salipiger bermudensis]|uniref:SDR family NAD(P)-dependent oxidoreductase n=1 Tax=Salipiger bermudensis TaxID=344736 RepID=UPI001A8BFD9D|nr:SDR family NAD(P)-dependent oxidoreductase [Salipiger bermudensis]MBN9678817.1 SDR family NAD(P)-dependent oxidoreductase [Salipiger bermudensis]
MTRKVMLLTGGSRGIGLGIALEAARRGWFVSLGLRGEAALPQELAAKSAEAVTYDATAAGEAAWVEGVMQRYGRIDAVVACAGLLDHDTIVTQDDAAVLRLFEVNAHAPRRLAAAAWQPLIDSGDGRIVVMASLSGKRVKSQRSGLYAFSKFAAVGLAHALRHEGWDHGIRATAICPGLVATDMGLSAADGGYSPEDMTQVSDLAALTLNTIEMPGTLCQAEITLNCQPDGIH